MSKHIVISIEQQTLQLFEKEESYHRESSTDKVASIVESCKLINTYQVSTAKNGIGSLENSGCTPLGMHKIAQKIGDNVPINSVFVGRKLTGEVYDNKLGTQNPDRDWILSRILWLSGLEEGVNKGKQMNTNLSCDTFSRYIYIHGTPDTEPMGEPLSHGCVRMRNKDIIELYDKVEEGTPVIIKAQ